VARRKSRGSVRTVFRNVKSRARRPRKNDFKKYGKKALLGVAAGLAISVPLTWYGRKTGNPVLIEAGQRVGSVASTYMGGTIGNASYQAADAIFDRVLVSGGGVPSFSGSQGQVYL